MNFGKRKRKILSAIIKKHIEFGVPIGSKTVCNELDIVVSSATVRSEMAELSELGYLDQPHTSAGRIPSRSGYRLYVNHLMEAELLSEDEKNFINGTLCSVADDPERLLNETAKLLSKITNLTAVLTTPPNYKAKIRDVQFVITGKRNAMLILMTTTGIVQNKLFRCNYNITEELINAFRRVINDKFKGKFLKDLNPESMNMLAATDSDMFLLMSPVLNALMEATREALEIHVKVSGETNLLMATEFKSEDVIKVFKFLRSKEDMLKILFTRERGTSIFIGEEDLHPDFGAVSVITSRYTVGGRSGAIGVIGPVRMNYSALIAKIEYLSVAVGGWLGRILEIDT